jgi:hypothetical protein
VYEKVLRHKLVRQIEARYPPDAKSPINARIGQQLLDAARAAVRDWRAESTSVLRELPKLNRQYARKVPPLRRK